MPRRVVWIALHGGAADMGVRARALWVAIEAVIQARALIVNGGTLFSPCPHLFFRRGTRRPTAVRLQKEKPHSPWLAAGGNFANDSGGAHSCYVEVAWDRRGGRF